MYRGLKLACPACQAELVLSPASLTAHRCDTCGGSWLGPEATVHLMQGIGDAQDTELGQVTREASARAHVATEANAAGRACPVCEAALTPISFGSVLVDSCVAHGTFFDRFEVDQVLEVCRKYRDAKAHEGKPSVSDIADTAASIAVGSANVATQGAWSIVTSLFLAIFSTSESERERQRDEDIYYGRR